MTRPPWDDYFLQLLNGVSVRASCDRGRSAAILVRDNCILSTGYVGAPRGLKDCDEVGHDIALVSISRETEMEQGIMAVTSEHCLRTVHAESNVIANAARMGIRTMGATMYCSMVPCETCAKLIIQAGIVRVVAKNRYHRDERTRTMFALVDIDLKVMDKNTTY